jgi:hypothetical protein
VPTNRSRTGTRGTGVPGAAVLVADDVVVAELPHPDVRSAAVEAVTSAARIIRNVDCVYKLIEPQRF